MAKKAAAAKTDSTVEEKLVALYNLQKVDSEIDRIRTIRGELPLEVQDLEDDIAGLETRLGKLTDEVNSLEDSIVERKNMITDALALIKKYEGQQGKVRNNREFDSLNKEIEYQNLEIQLCEKKMKEHRANIETKNELIESTTASLDERKKDLAHKKTELDGIISETEKDEKKLVKESDKAKATIEQRLITAYSRIRDNSLNGLAVVKVERNACGGCFNKIPPQRQLDISMRKKVIVCEHCGRVLVDPEIDGVPAE